MLLLRGVRQLGGLGGLLSSVGNFNGDGFGTPKCHMPHVSASLPWGGGGARIAREHDAQWHLVWVLLKHDTEQSMGTGQCNMTTSCVMVLMPCNCS